MDTKPVFTFVHMQHKLHPKLDELVKQWYLLIDNEEALDAFAEVQGRHLGYEYYCAKTNVMAHRHSRSREQETIAILLGMQDPPSRGMGDDIAYISDKLSLGYARIFCECGKIFVNRNLGFCTLPDQFEPKILRSIKATRFIFPEYTEKDIKVSQWAGGKHWYAKIGTVDVQDKNGNVKWSSYESAFQVAKQSLNELNEE